MWVIHVDSYWFQYQLFALLMYLTDEQILIFYGEEFKPKWAWRKSK